MDYYLLIREVSVDYWQKRIYLLLVAFIISTCPSSPFLFPFFLKGSTIFCFFYRSKMFIFHASKEVISYIVSFFASLN